MLLALIVSRSVTQPLNGVVAALKISLRAKADLTRRLEVANRDEVGDLANGSTSRGQLQTVIRSLAENVQQLAASSTELSAVPGTWLRIRRIVGPGQTVV